MIDTKAPERIWAYSWTGKEGRQGQWNYNDTSRYYGNVFEYIRADLYDALAKERDELEAEVERLRGVLNDIYENVEYWNTLRISSKIRAALQRKEGNE